MNQTQPASESFTGTVLTLATLLLLSVGLLSILGLLFSLPREEPIHSALDHKALDVDQLVPDRL